MLRTAQTIGTNATMIIGVTSSFTYALQACCQIKRHGFRHWLEAGFEKAEEKVEEELRR